MVFRPCRNTSEGHQRNLSKSRCWTEKKGPLKKPLPQILHLHTATEAKSRRRPQGRGLDLANEIKKCAKHCQHRLHRLCPLPARYCRCTATRKQSNMLEAAAASSRNLPMNRLPRRRCRPLCWPRPGQKLEGSKGGGGPLRRRCQRDKRTAVDFSTRIPGCACRLLTFGNVPGQRGVEFPRAGIALAGCLRRRRRREGEKPPHGAGKRALGPCNTLARCFETCDVQASKGSSTGNGAVLPQAPRSHLCNSCGTTDKLAAK